MTKDIQPFADRVYQEILSHIKQTDLDVPVKLRGNFYYARTEEGKQYPIRCRRQGSMEAPEQILLDLNQLGEGKKFVGLGATAPERRSKSVGFYTIDYTGFRQFTLQNKRFAHG